MDQIPALFFVLLWAIVILQGLAILFLYRLVGLNLLGRAEALTRGGLKLGKRLPEVELRRVERNEVVPIPSGILKTRDEEQRCVNRDEQF